MQLDASQLLLIAATASAAVAAGIALLQSSKWRMSAWLAFILGAGALGLLALLLLTGRFGPENLWFRTPAFYLAAIVLLGAAAWWLRRPAPRLLRFGLPALVIGGLAIVGLLAPAISRWLLLHVKSVETEARAENPLAPNEVRRIPRNACCPRSMLLCSSTRPRPMRSSKLSRSSPLTIPGTPTFPSGRSTRNRRR